MYICYRLLYFAALALAGSAIGNEDELCRVQNIVKASGTIEVNYGRRQWSEQWSQPLPPWECITQCRLWSSEDWAPFRQALQRPRGVLLLLESDNVERVTGLSGSGLVE